MPPPLQAESPTEPPIRKPGTLGADLLAGLSVALVVIPQSLAYADLAGMPAWHGLYVAAVAPLVAAPLLSCRYLQPGPVAMTALLTFGALGGIAAPYSEEYVSLAALLALLVGTIRLGIGLLGAGGIAWLLSSTVVRGFTFGAAVLIFSSQVPAALGVHAEAEGVVHRALWTLRRPDLWSPGAAALSTMTLCLVLGGRKLHALFPGVLVAALLGLIVSDLGLPVGPVIGPIPAGLPSLQLDLPWERIPVLLLPAAVLALAGFAEGTSLGRTFAAETRESWDPNREFRASGAANFTAGLFGGFPAGSSFSRSSLSRVAGTKTRLAPFITGLAVLAVLPAAHLLETLPHAILGATVLAAVVRLLKPGPMITLWRHSKRESLIAWATCGATLIAAPHVEFGVITGVLLSLLFYLHGGGRQHRLDARWRQIGGQLTLHIHGDLWFAISPPLLRQSIDRLRKNPVKQLHIDLSGLHEMDISSASVLGDVIHQGRSAGAEVAFLGASPERAKQLRTILGPVTGL